MEAKEPKQVDTLMAPRPIAKTQRQADALAELSAYLEANEDALRATLSKPDDRNLYTWGSAVADGFTAPDVLEDTLDTLRGCMDDPYPQDDRELVAAVHSAMAEGLVPPAGRSRFAHWYSDAAGVRCSCGRTTWGWTMVKDQTPVPLGPVDWKWWRVQCMRCALVSLILYPECGDRYVTPHRRAELDATHRAVVDSYVGTPDAPTVTHG